MRRVSPHTMDVWQSGRYVGKNRAVVRATVQRLNQLVISVGTQLYASVPFAQPAVPAEIPNIKSVKWSRKVDGGVATMSMELFNTNPVPLGETPEADLDRPGYYTYQRGAHNYSTMWDHKANAWQDRLVPDRIIRTYEGYGFDPEKTPEEDPNLYSSGVWMIDDVTFTAEGMIQIECRDIGRVLMDQVCMPPVIPSRYYPLSFEKQVITAGPDVLTANWIVPLFDKTSNEIYGEEPIAGHYSYDAFDTNSVSYWLSVGNAGPSESYSYEYVQGKLATPATVSAVRIHPWGGPYTAYVSLYANGQWIGDKLIPYDDPGVPNNDGRLPYVTTFRVERELATEVTLPAQYPGVTRIRVTFTDLSNSTIGPPYYRAGVRTFQIATSYTTTPGIKTATPPSTPPGISDYTDIVKLLLAYGGFYWPMQTAFAFRTLSNGSLVYERPDANDPLLGEGRVWGDLQMSGTVPETPLGVEVWDKKPLMDCINYVRDILGFMFYIDEEGAVVFRSPNIYTVGNWIGTGAIDAGRTTDVITIADDQVLLGLSAKLSSRSIRESVFVGSPQFGVGAVSKGRNPFPAGLRRVGGWTDTNFGTERECQIMADLITMRQMFTYRTDTVRIPGNPAIQIDDQVQLYERITEEGALHYVNGIQMNWSAETGVYTYDLDTHWLGESPYSQWAFDPAALSQETQEYIRAMNHTEQG